MRLTEKLTHNGIDYEDSYGEDLPQDKKDYKTVNIDGVDKKLYKGGKFKGNDRYYVKYRSYEPITQDDSFNNKESLKFIAYKQFKTRYNPSDPETEKYKGLLFPLFVGDTGNLKDGIKVGKWYSCGVGELRIPVTEEGIPIDGSSIQVGSKLGNLSYRPGWHLASMPLTRHIGKGKTSDGDYDSTCSQYVWCKVEYSAHFDFTEEAHAKSSNSRQAYFTNKNEFKNGFYHFKTNSNASDEEDWLIADKIKVLEVLTDIEVRKIVGEKAQKRWIADGSENCKFMADFTQFGKMAESSKSKRYTEVKGYANDDNYSHAPDKVTVEQLKYLLDNPKMIARYFYDQSEFTACSNCGKLDKAVKLGQTKFFDNGFLPEALTVLEPAISLVKKLLEKYPKNIKIFRGVEIYDAEPDLEHLGICWTYNKALAEDFVNQFDDDSCLESAPCVISGETDLDNVDWLMTLLLLTDAPEEKEIRVWDDTKVKVLDWEVL